MGSLKHYSHILVGCLGAFIVGCGIGLHLFALPNAMVLAAVVVGLSLIILKSPKAGWVRVSFALLLFLFGMVSTYYRVQYQGPYDIAQWAPLSYSTLEGVVTSLRSKQDGKAYRATLDVHTINGHHATGKVMLWKVPAPFAPIQSEVIVSGILREPKAPLFEHGFNEGAYLRAHGVSAVLNRPKLDKILTTQAPTALGHFLKQITGYQQRIQQGFSTYLPNTEAQLLGGVVLGDRAVDIPSDVKKDFINTGLIHFLAASGFNVGVVAAAVLFLLRRVHFSEGYKLLLAGLFVGIYMVLAGWSPSVVRAGGMILLAFSFRAVNQSLSPLMLLMLTVALIVGFHPPIIDDLGFQLSVLTTLGIIVMVPSVQRWACHYMSPWLAGLLVLPIVAQIWVMPLLVTTFNQFPFHSVPLNIGALVCVTPLTVIGFVAAFVTMLWPGVGALISALAYPFAWALLWMVHWGAQFEQFVWHPTSPPVWLMWGCYGALVIATWVLNAPYVRQVRHWGVVRRWAVSLVVPVMLCLVFVSQMWLQSNQHQVIAVPLSERVLALDVRPAHQNKSVLVLPKPVGYWEQRNMRDYVRHHRSPSSLEAVVYAEGTVEKTPLLKGFDSTRTIFLEKSSPIELSQGWGPGSGQGLVFQRETPFLEKAPAYRVMAGDTCLLLGTGDYRQTFDCAYTYWAREHRHARLFQQ